MPFTEGTYGWEIQVNNVKSIWLGIVNGGEGEIANLDSLPGTAEGYMLVFGNGGSPVIQHSEHNNKTAVKILGNTKFTSGQMVSFKLQVNSKTLEMKIDGQVAVIATNVECRGSLPYVCMGYTESATLISRYHVPSCNQNDEKYSISWEPDLEVTVESVRKWGKECIYSDFYDSS